MSFEEAQRFAEALDEENSEAFDETLYRWIHQTNLKVLEVAQAAGYDLTEDELIEVLRSRLVEGDGNGQASTCFLSERPGR